MNSLPAAVTTPDCIRSLTELGFARVCERDGQTLLARKHRVVRVPSRPVIDPETLASILKSGCISRVEFTDMLASLDLMRLADVFEDD
jgi:hypothetical protein